MAKKKIRKTHRKYESKYYKKHGYSIKDCAMWLGWSESTVQAYFQDKDKREEMLAMVKQAEGGD